MTKELENQSQKENLEVVPKVGLRLQDVILRIETDDPIINSIRSEVLPLLDGTKNERLAVLQAVSNKLLNMNLEDLRAETSSRLIPYHNTDGKNKKALIISSATSSSASQETECAILEKHGRMIDIPGAIEGRDTNLAKSGDTAVIGTKAGLEMVNSKHDLEIVNLADAVVLECSDKKKLKGSDIYYKADGLLLLLLTKPKHEVVSVLAEQLAEDVVVYPYNLDEETQISLLSLMNLACVPIISVYANSSEVGIELTRKGYRYPTVNGALSLSHINDPRLMQFEEWKLSQSASEVGYHPDFMPGYVIEWKEDYDEMRTQVLSAGLLLWSRYGIRDAWLKPDRGTDGGGQRKVSIEKNSGSTRSDVIALTKPGMWDLALGVYADELEIGELTEVTESVWKSGADWVLEARTIYFDIKIDVGGGEHIIKTIPSVHVIEGQTRPTVSLQLMNDEAWGGNIICSRETWIQLMNKVDSSDVRFADNPNLKQDLNSCYDRMSEAMFNYVSAINNSVRYNGGQVRGGADLAVATLGGDFGDELVVAVQDFNARANGCEACYALYDMAKQTYGERGEAVTKNLQEPKVGYRVMVDNLAEIVARVNDRYGKNLSLSQVKIIAVSEGWGQIGVVGEDAIEILEDILLIEEQMRLMNLIN